jgi:Icc-related predicted phosphoesterase
MRILLGADFHGLEAAFSSFGKILAGSPYGIGILAGDLMTYPSEDHFRAAQKRLSAEGSGVGGDPTQRDADAVAIALREEELELKGLLSTSEKPVLFIMGNDDGIVGGGVQWKSEGRFVDINERAVDLGRHRFVGYQYTTPFVGGPFERPEQRQEANLVCLEALMDEHTLFVSHGPAYGVLDVGADGEHYGSRALLAFLRRKPVRLHLFGHIHNSWGVQGNAVNAAYPASRQFASTDLETGETSWVG